MRDRVCIEVLLVVHSSDEDDSATGSLDLGLGVLAEELRLDDDGRGGQLSVTKNLEVSLSRNERAYTQTGCQTHSLGHVDDGCLVGLLGEEGIAGLRRRH